MSKLWKMLGVLIGIVGLICIGICIFAEGKNQIFLSMGLLCNSFALFTFCLIIKKKK